MEENKEPKWVHGKYTKAQGQISNRYMKKTYDTILLRMRKDGSPSKADYEKAAKAAGMSLNQFILDAVDRRIDEMHGLSF